MPSEDNLGKVDEVFTNWAREGRGERMEQSHRETAGPALAGMRIRPGSRFLDLGAGNGWAARAAAERGAKAVAVDVSFEMLRRARKTLGVEAVRADLARLPFKDATFGAAWSMEALYYVPALREALAEAARVLEPEAEAAVVVDRYRENAASHGWDEMLGVPMHLLSEDEWRAATKDAGFSSVASGRLRDLSADDWRRAEGSLHIEASR